MTDKIKWESGGFDKDSNLTIKWNCPDCKQHHYQLYSFLQQILFPKNGKVCCEGCGNLFIFNETPEN